jgi:hypothetical protein
LAKIRNKNVYSNDHAFLQRLADELEFIGRAYRLDLENGVLTQFALPPPKPPKKKPAERGPRNKRAESAGRHVKD